MIKNKYVFVGEENSINNELIFKSFSKVKNKVKYILIGNYDQLQKDSLKFKIRINKINDPFDFNKLEKESLNVFHFYNKNESKNKNLLNQIHLSNDLANITRNDLITMPINKSNLKKDIIFNGMTEYLGKINNCNTLMLMVGDNFSIIPITTHINIKYITTNLEKKLNDFIYNFNSIKKQNDKLNKYKSFNFLCINPHCSENGTIGPEDIILKKIVSKLDKTRVKFHSADSAFLNIKKNSLFFSLYHDQALIPFKILNKDSFNLTLGLRYRRISPSHGTANDIINKNIANNNSYLKCMLI